jgi:hypothetical protein
MSLQYSVKSLGSEITRVMATNHSLPKLQKSLNLNFCLKTTAGHNFAKLAMCKWLHIHVFQPTLNSSGQGSVKAPTLEAKSQRVVPTLVVSGHVFYSFTKGFLSGNSVLTTCAFLSVWHLITFPSDRQVSSELCGWLLPSISRFQFLFWTLLFSSLSVNLACCLHHFVIKSYMYKIPITTYNLQVEVNLGKLPVLHRSLFFRHCNSKR